MTTTTSFQLFALLLVLSLTTAISGCRLGGATSIFNRNSNINEIDALKLQIEKDGIYGVSLQDLSKSGMNVSTFSIDNLRLSQSGETVPTLFLDDVLVFYGKVPDNRYVSEGSYILELGKPGLEMSKITASESPNRPNSKLLQTLHLEENLEYVSEARQEDQDDVWFWYKLRQQDTFTIEAELPHIDVEQAVIRINTWGFTFDQATEGDHSIDVLINDQLVGDVVWDGQTYNTAEISIPAGILKPGMNSITLDNRPEGATFLDIMLVNWIELDYLPAVQDITDQVEFTAEFGSIQLEPIGDQPIILSIDNPTAPEQIVNLRVDNNQIIVPIEQEMKIVFSSSDEFLSPKIENYRNSRWHNEEQQADLIIVTTDELAPSLTPLVEAREAQGLSVALVPVEEIYDAFGLGESSPESIQNFVKFAYEHWQEPKPRYLFLVGDATIDYEAYVSDVPRNNVPSLVVPVQFSGETVSDSRLADIDGDKRPDLAVGRWPLRTVEEAKSLVERTLEYEQGQAAEKIILAADGSESQFQLIASELASSANLPQDQVHILVGSPAEEITAELNKGSWLVTYIGHGSIGRWGKEGIFELESVAGLAPDTPPIVLQFTCLTGLFSHPEEVSLSEALLSHPKGPVLTVAATSLTLSRHQETFAVELLNQIQDDDVKRIGDAFQNAKLSLDIESSNGLREISDTFALFGDPSTVIVRP